MQEKPSDVPLPPGVDTGEEQDEHGADTVPERCQDDASPAESLNPESLHPPAPQRGRQRHEYTDEFEQAWALYPKRSGDNPKHRAFKAWNARLREGHSADEMIEGIRRYGEWCRETGKEGQETVKQAATLLGPDKGFLEQWETKAKRPNKVVV